MIFTRENGQEIFRDSGALGVRLNTQNNCEYVHLSIEPGAQIERHQLPLPVTFYVISGRGLITTPQDSRTVASGSLLELPQDLPREWTNPGPERLELLVIKHLSRSI